MNVLYLLKILDTNKLSELVAAMEMPPLDMNLILWGAIEAGELEIDENKDRVKMLAEKESIQSWHDPVLANKLIRTIQHYAKNGTNITVGRMNACIKDPGTGEGYKLHEYLMTMQHLIDTGQVVEEVVSVPKANKRPFHRFVFLCLPENDNQEMNARAVNKWIDNWKPSKVK